MGTLFKKKGSTNLAHRSSRLQTFLIEKEEGTGLTVEPVGGGGMT
jgi:hypothetical protein